MTRAGKATYFITEDIDTIIQSLTRIRQGLVKKVDCHSENMGRAIQVLSDLKEHLPSIIIDSEE